MPSSSTSSARRVNVVSCAGWLPGKTTSIGCGSNVINTVGTPRDRPALTAWLISSACPRCTPSNTPIVTTHLPQSVGISSCPRQRCTVGKPTAQRRARLPHIPRSGDHCLNFVTVSPNGNPRDLTTVAQDYLKVIWTAQEWSLEKVSTKMLAERIGVSASTASESIRKLADQGLVDHEKYGAVTLTEAGRKAALAMVRRHRLMETFLVRDARLQLGRGARRGRGARARRLRPDAGPHRRQARLSRSATRTAIRFRPPTATCRRRTRGSCRCADDGDTGTVARISDADPEMLRYFDSVGISLDSRLLVLARRDFAGMISVAIKSADAGETTGTTVDLGSPAAEAIWVVG